MGKYLPLFSIMVEHLFFNEGLCPGYDFFPSDGTKGLLRNGDLLTRNIASGIQVFFNEDKVEALQRDPGEGEDDLCFSYMGFARDPLFINYTEIPPPREMELLYFDNRRTTTEKGKIRLHLEKYVSAKDFINVNASLFKDILEKKDRLMKPTFVVSICVKQGGTELMGVRPHTAVNDYYLCFKARQTYWKYNLLGSVAEKKPFIVDLDQKTEFTFAGNRLLTDKRSASTFISNKPLSLRDKSDYRFQLRTGEVKGGEMLIKRLSVASPHQLEREIINGKEAFVSEIYINS